MLILSRKRHQRIRISDNIWLEVLHTGRSTVKLGFTAPQGFAILREELIDVPRLPVSEADERAVVEVPVV